MLTERHAIHFAEMALGHVTREYPNKLDQVLTGQGDLQSPRALHPVFYGSFDWHSCVHAFWMLARVLRRYPDAPHASRIRAQFDAAFTSAHIATELDYLARPFTATFERPYGWAWLLMLAAEVAERGSDDGRRWSAALQPLGSAFAARFVAHLPKATYPVRTGMHSNTILAMEYATVCRDRTLADAVADAARRWYG